VLKENNRVLRENNKLGKVQKENNNKVRFTWIFYIELPHALLF
jgi:hypothetical protein